MLDQLLALVAPPACALCGSGCEVGSRMCEGCDSALRSGAPVRSAVPGVDEVWSAAPYDGAARHLVAALKFRARPGLAEEAAALIAGRAPALIHGGTIVPVPAAPARRRRRGFDAAEEIASALARRCGLAIAPCLVRSESPRQVGRRRAERLSDPPRISATSRAPVEALLVDDVMTTGATLGACAEALRSAGAARVIAITVAASKSTRRGLGAGARAA